MGGKTDTTQLRRSQIAEGSILPIRTPLSAIRILPSWFQAPGLPGPPDLTGQRPTVACSAVPSSNDVAIVLDRFVAVLFEIPPAGYIIRQPFGVFVRHLILHVSGPALFHDAAARDGTGW